MRLANHGGRLVLLRAGGEGDLDGTTAIDVNLASRGAIPSEPDLAYEHWDEVRRLAEDPPDDAAQVTVEQGLLRSPSPRPRQVFGVGVNYADHGDEAGMAAPEVPLIFTKLTTAVTGPFARIPLSSATVDWEAEIAVVIGRRAERVDASRAWSHVAGITAGQDLSDRDIQWRPRSTPQFCLGKSLAGFAPLGPTLVSVDEYPDPDDIELRCLLNGEQVQRSSSGRMLLSVPEIIAYLSGIVALYPGDVIFTGTPGGIGMTRTPPRYLRPGDTLQTFVAGAGTMSHTFTAGCGQAPERAHRASGRFAREGSDS
ncbi:MAG TPA: fumarylacetoacetate hydrolase family protein [Solirubrobacteraceae bacterium]|nr:fumarylacetoacetate hydrolase family protein [Solirubrobacteraceae bacterium]